MKKRNAFSRLTYKYKLLIVNENTLEETFRLKISWLSLIVWAVLFFVITFAILATLILFTPVKYMLPGYADRTMRERVVDDYMRIDSLSSELELRDRQLIVIKNIIAGNIEVDSIESIPDSLSLEALKRLPLGPSQQEQTFVATYEDDNLYNVDNFAPKENIPESMLLAAPVHGTIHDRFSPDNSGITILAKAGSPILAALKGTIIYTHEIPNRGYTVIISHEYGYTTIYHNIGRLIHRDGDSVDTGEAIGFLSSDDNTSLSFQLLRNGIPVNPEDYIIF